MLLLRFKSAADLLRQTDNIKNKVTRMSDFIFYGDPYGNRTHVSSVRG